MNEVVTSQASLFITSIQIGILMGMFFDLIRVFRKILPHPNFLVQIEDMLFWIICGFVGFYRLYICNYADIRPYILLGIVLGGIFYLATFSIIFMKIAIKVIDFVKAIIHKIVLHIVMPFCRQIKRLINWTIGWLTAPFKYIIKKGRHFLYLNKLVYRQYKRQQYEKKSDKRTEQYIKKNRT